MAIGHWSFSAKAEEPSVAYIFPAGGQRGTTVQFRVGGHFFHGEAGFEMLGPGVTAAPRVRETNTIWFEGPMIVQPASQGKEDYPRDHAGSVRIASDAAAGMRHWRVWTSQGATAAMKFLVGELPEVIEQEQDGVALPVPVQPPVTINGRIFPREDVDVWSFPAKAGQEFTCTVAAQAIRSPLQARLVALDPAGRELAEAVASPRAEPRLHFRAAADGTYAVRIHDVSFGGLQHYVYRLTITAEPMVTSVFPLGGRRGATVKLDLAGNALPARTAELKLPADAPKSFSAPLLVGGKQTGPVRLEVDELPEHLATASESPATFTPPATLNGRITKPGAANLWTFTAKKGDALECVLAAARLGSPLTPVLAVTDAEGKPLGRVEAAPGDGGDATLQFKAPEDGTFTLRIAERFTSRGGPDFAYRLRVALPAVAVPDFQLTLVSDAVNVVRDLPDGAAAADPVKKPRNRQKPGQLKLNVTAAGGFAGEIELTVDGLPPQVAAANTKIAAKKATHDLSFNAEPLAKIAATRVTIRGTAMIGGQPVTRVATLPAPRDEAGVDTVLLAVAMPTPFKVGGEYSMTLAPRGTVFQKHFTLARGGFIGPLTVQLADRQGRHLQGVTGRPIVLPPDAEGFDYPVFLPPWMELGRTSRSVIATLGVIKDHDGTEHIVSFSAGEQNDQLIAVLETGHLDVASRQRSLTVTPGKAATVEFQLQRDASLANESVRVELVLPAHILGVKAAPVVVPAGKDAATLTISFAAECGPFNAPALLRATTLNTHKPHVAETKLELIPPAGLRVVTQ